MVLRCWLFGCLSGLRGLCARRVWRGEGLSLQKARASAALRRIDREGGRSGTLNTQHSTLNARRDTPRLCAPSSSARPTEDRLPFQEGSHKHMSATRSFISFHFHLHFHSEGGPLAYAYSHVQNGKRRNADTPRPFGHPSLEGSCRRMFRHSFTHSLIPFHYPSHSEGLTPFYSHSHFHFPMPA